MASRRACTSGSQNMALTITKTDYKFADLNDDGKEKAIQWFRDAIAHDDWYDSVYE